MSVTVDPKRCPQNHRCPMIFTCPVQAISQDGFGLPKIDHNKCIRCGKCIKQCPMRAMNLEK